MAKEVLFPRFREEQRSTRYPFSDSATMVSASGMEILSDTFLDGVFYPINAGPRLYLQRIESSSREISFYVHDAANVFRCVASFDPLDAPDRLIFADQYRRPAGMMLSEPLLLARFAAWPNGIHQFTLGDTEFVATAVIPVPAKGVRGVITEKQIMFTGDMWIVGDNGVVVREVDGNIRVDVVGDPLFVRRLCGAVERFVQPRFIETINGCPPDEFGNFNLTVGDHLNAETIVRIYATPDGLVIEAVGDLTIEN